MGGEGKRVVFGKSIKLDTKITNELKTEGMIRELIRSIQGMRKDGGLKPGQMIYLRYSADSSLKDLIQKYESEIKKEVSAKQINIGDKKQKFLVEKEIKLDNQKIWLGIKPNK